jgi:hypothetical protein
MDGEEIKEAPVADPPAEEVPAAEADPAMEAPAEGGEEPAEVEAVDGDADTGVNAADAGEAVEGEPKESAKEPASNEREQEVFDYSGDASK